ncbi:oxygen-independent coproporphyrinogen III oxidase [Helicobacter sp. faydin-H20]|uniref:oxygen-independent coproporphyrinogen III oxidase n=1 Tax=Helicobacter anatolicus TaxID=2905874 RepID=UPI001E61AB5E|nr:oxygen-independent coproporphyrinogen III oxidase [Helicobacter anatolicus]MCE3036262.1 oxygen-independent coproporphyrinogen III oxidase [Helicobacter anatolicus]
MIDFKKFSSYSKSGPRYTSYPTAVEFSENFTQETLQEAFLRNDKRKDIPLSIYVHLPFCKSACYFCACNVIYTNSEEKKERYLGYLRKELEILKTHMDTRREVVQLHFGGGTPTYFSAKQLEEVITLIRSTFTNFASNAEVSCEIDPRHFTEDQMIVLKNGGFNRVSFGVQDFDEKVQKAINRYQSMELMQNVVGIARKHGIFSINFDLIYGLPYQDINTFEETLKKAISLKPDRFAIFNYAHVPWIKRTMANIDESTLPTPENKLKILEFTIKFLQENDYKMIGMDHFAKADDELYLASQKGELRRNFQGYTTRGFSQTIGIGLTSIGEGVDYYVQNYKDIKKYEKALDEGKLPVERGVVLDFDDILRKEVIMQLMNNSKLYFYKIEEKFLIDFKEHFAKELQALQVFVDDGILEITEEGIFANPTGSMLIRNIAMCFDAYLEKIPQEKRRFSKTI